MQKNEVYKIYKSMRETMEGSSAFHTKRRNLYRGNHEAYSLNIALDSNFEHKLNTKLEWPRIAVDVLANSVKFDAFKNDSMGFTRMLSEAGAFPVISAAIKNSMIGSCAFVSIIPRDSANGELPIFTAYSGSEATGVYDSKTNKLKYGLAINSFDSFGIAQDYLFFGEGFIAKIKADYDETDFNGRNIEFIETPINECLLVPFVYNQDLAVRPFGESRLNSGSIQALESALRTLKLVEIANELSVGMGHILLTSGTPDEFEGSELMQKMGRFNVMFSQDPASTMNLERLVGPSTKELQEQMLLFASNFAAATSISPTVLGIQPSNGSFSSQTLGEQQKPYLNLLESCRESYGESIKKLAILSMGLMTETLNSDWNTIVPVWLENFSIDNLGKMGDAIGKIAAISIEIADSDFIKRQLGIPLRDELLNVRYPNFKASREAVKKYKTLETKFIAENGDVIKNKMNSPMADKNSGGYLGRSEEYYNEQINGG